MDSNNTHTDIAYTTERTQHTPPPWFSLLTGVEMRIWSFKARPDLLDCIVLGSHWLSFSQMSDWKSMAGEMRCQSDDPLLFSATRSGASNRLRVRLLFEGRDLTCHVWHLQHLTTSEEKKKVHVQDRNLLHAGFEERRKRKILSFSLLSLLTAVWWSHPDATSFPLITCSCDAHTVCSSPSLFMWMKPNGTNGHHITFWLSSLSFSSHVKSFVICSLFSSDFFYGCIICSKLWSF